MDQRIHHQHLFRVLCDVDETVQRRSEAVVLVSVCSVKRSYQFQVRSRLTNAAAAAAAAAAVHFCIHKHHASKKFFNLELLT